MDHFRKMLSNSYILLVSLTFTHARIFSRTQFQNWEDILYIAGNGKTIAPIIPLTILLWWRADEWSPGMGVANACTYTQQINNRIWKNNTKNKNLQWVKEVVLQYVSFNLFKKDNQLKSGSSNKSWIVTLSQERTAYTTTITSKIHPKRSRQHVRRHQLAGLDLSHFILVTSHLCTYATGECSFARDGSGGGTWWINGRLICGGRSWWP